MPLYLSRFRCTSETWARLIGNPEVECPRFRGHLSAGSALSGLAGRIGVHVSSQTITRTLPARVPA